MLLPDSARLYLLWWRKWGTAPIASWINAASLYRSGDYRRAAQAYIEGLESHPDHPARVWAKLDLAFCFFKTGYFQECEHQLTTTVAAFPGNREASQRLASFQIWMGRYLEAAWVARRALVRLGPELDMASLYMQALQENGGPKYLLEEAKEYLGKTAGQVVSNSNLRFELVRAREELENSYTSGRAKLLGLAALPNSSVEIKTAFAELLFREGKVAEAHNQLCEALTTSANHPRVLSLLAETHLAPGELYNPEHAISLAIGACQNSGWANTWTLHVLAEAYYLAGDGASALMIASKARYEGSRLLGAYPGAKALDKLIQVLSSCS